MWRRQVNELVMRRHFTRSTERRRRVFWGQGALCVHAVQSTGIIELIPTVTRAQQLLRWATVWPQ